MAKSISPKIYTFSLLLILQLYFSYLHYFDHEGEERFISLSLMILLHLIIAFIAFMAFLFLWRSFRTNLSLLIAGLLAVYIGSDSDSEKFKISFLLMDFLLFMQILYWYLSEKAK